jgi:hypothetical protein
LLPGPAIYGLCAIYIASLALIFFDAQLLHQLLLVQQLVEAFLWDGKLNSNEEYVIAR